MWPTLRFCVLVESPPGDGVSRIVELGAVDVRSLGYGE